MRNPGRQEDPDHGPFRTPGPARQARPTLESGGLRWLVWRLRRRQNAGVPFRSRLPKETSMRRRQFWSAGVAALFLLGVAGTAWGVIQVLYPLQKLMDD